MLQYPAPNPFDLMVLCGQLAETGIAAGVTHESGTLSFEVSDALGSTLEDILAIHPALATASATSPTARASHRALLQRQAIAALSTNRTFLALSTPTNAQSIAQVRALTRQANGLIRLALGLLDSDD